MAATYQQAIAQTLQPAAVNKMLEVVDYLKATAARQTAQIGTYGTPRTEHIVR